MGTTRRDFLASAGFSFVGLSGDFASAAEYGILNRFDEKKLATDVVIAGGGLAGVCAAIAAARNGAKVVLIQNRSRLGGNSSSEIRMHVCGANHSKALAPWRETGIIEELKLTNAATNPQRSFEVWDLILYDKVVSEPNITLLLDTAVIDAHVENDRIRSVVALSPLLEAQYEIGASFFIDCTGDCGLAVAAGAEIMRGREARAMYNESLAPEKADSKTMGNSLLFMARQHAQPMTYTPPSWARRFTAEDFRHRQIHSWEYGYWWIEWGGEIDTIADNAQIRHELLRALFGIWDYIKNSGQHPKSANWALEWVGMLPGKRESRRIVGDHVMTQSELERADEYPDRVSFGGWPMDDHPPGGIDASGEKPAQQIYFKRPYHVPLRSLYSKNRPNLFMAGRNISASHVAFSSTRVMATCAAMGQAVGNAAAFCGQEKCAPSEIVAEPERMKRFQQLLLKNDQSLVNVRNEDSMDSARRARITCSAETPAGKAIAIVDGWTRDIGDGSTHQWQAPMPDPWVMLEWDSPQRIGTIQVTFDTGLHRKLFLSGEDSTYADQLRGPQPETVSDYVIEARIDGAWHEVAKGTNNVLRRVHHRLAPSTITALRVRVLRTQGDLLARVYEVRAYTA